MQVLTTGRAAAASGVLMTAGVAGEWVLNPQRSDGSVTNTPVFALLVATSTVGFALLGLAARSLRTHFFRDTRPARAGASMTWVGGAFLTVFGVVALVTGVASGKPLEASFLFFALGMLLLTFGPLTWGLALRRGRHARGLWQLLVASGVAAFAAVAIPLDPGHDIALVGMFGTWSALGVALLRGSHHEPDSPDVEQLTSVPAAR